MATLGIGSAVAPSAYREGQVLVVPCGCRLPAACVRCGKPSEDLLSKTFRWHSPWLYILILVGVLFYVIVALVVQKKARIDIPFCHRHRLWRSRMNMVGAVLLIGSVPLSILLGLLDVDGGIVALVAVATAFAGALVFGIVGGSFAAVYIDENCAKFKGASQQFLSLLPNRGTSE